MPLSLQPTHAAVLREINWGSEILASSNPQAHPVTSNLAFHRTNVPSWP